MAEGGRVIWGGSPWDLHGFGGWIVTGLWDLISGSHGISVFLVAGKPWDLYGFNVVAG